MSRGKQENWEFVGVLLLLTLQTQTGKSKCKIHKGKTTACFSCCILVYFVILLSSTYFTLNLCIIFQLKRQTQRGISYRRGGGMYGE